MCEGKGEREREIVKSVETPYQNNSGLTMGISSIERAFCALCIMFHVFSFHTDAVIRDEIKVANRP